MTQDIKDKLNNKLRSLPYTEVDVVYILVQTYKILESSDMLESYKTIKFFRNWSCHAKLNGDAARIFKDAYTLIENQNSFKDRFEFIDAFTDQISICFSKYSFSKLRQQTEESFASLGVEGLNWEEFRKSLYGVIQDTPLIVLDEQREEIMRFKCVDAIYDMEHDDIEIEVTTETGVNVNITTNDLALEDN